MKKAEYDLVARRIAEAAGMTEIVAEQPPHLQFEQQLGDLHICLESRAQKFVFEGLVFTFSLANGLTTCFMQWETHSPQWLSDVIFDDDLIVQLFPPAYCWMRANTEPHYHESFLSEFRPHTSFHEKLEWSLKYDERIQL